MPWRERSTMDEKASFILEWESGEHTFKALCKSYGVSRTLGYRLVAALSATGCAGTAGAVTSSAAGVEPHRPRGGAGHRGSAAQVEAHRSAEDLPVAHSRGTADGARCLRCPRSPWCSSAMA